MAVICQEVLDFLGDYESGELPRAEGLRFRLHFRSCRSCRTYRETYRRTMALAKSLREGDAHAEVPPGFLREILLSREARG